MRAVGPSVPVFSVQRDGRFGNPHPAVLDRYTTLGAHLFRTDEHGAITVCTDVLPVFSRVTGSRTPHPHSA